MSAVTSFLGETVVRESLRYAARDPDRNLEILATWAERIAIHPDHRRQAAEARRVLASRSGNWYKLARKFLTEIHPNVAERLGVNFLVHASLLGIPRQRELARRYGFSIPWALLIDPTERCNLGCKGCWAGDYQPADLEYDVLDRVVSEGEQLGIRFIVISGGEPLLRWTELASLAADHPHSVFHVFTNGTLVNEAVAADIVRLGNVTLALSLEGGEEATDARRGRGVFARICAAAHALREAGALFGFSATYTRENVEELGDDRFMALVTDLGCCFGWFFTYIPVGADSDPSLMATPAQRAWMCQRVRRFRETWPAFIADFWNDGEAVQGCIAGGRRYLHINASGDVEPCAFVHYAADNIKDKSLLEVLGSPLMRAYQKRQPFNSNHLRPCPLIDNPEALAEIVNESGARPTQIRSCQNAADFAARLKPYAEEWGQTADALAGLASEAQH